MGKLYIHYTHTHTVITLSSPCKRALGIGCHVFNNFISDHYEQ